MYSKIEERLQKSRTLTWKISHWSTFYRPLKSRLWPFQSCYPLIWVCVLYVHMHVLGTQAWVGLCRVKCMVGSEIVSVPQGSIGEQTVLLWCRDPTSGLGDAKVTFVIVSSCTVKESSSRGPLQCMCNPDFWFIKMSSMSSLPTEQTWSTAGFSVHCKHALTWG